MPDHARAILSAIQTAQLRHGLLPVSTPGTHPPAPVVVGLSGGADSVCLLHALSLLNRDWNLALHAAHVDHGLRSESAADAAFSASFARQLSVPFHLCQLDGNALSTDERGVEAAARAARYAALAHIARSLAGAEPSRTVAVAHHMDDQAETVLMNIVRGSGLRGLAGMPWVRPIEETVDETVEETAEETEGETVHAPKANGQASAVRLVRPLLSARHDDILAYLAAFGLHHREDRSNSDSARFRNRIRHETLPALASLNAQIVETLGRTANIMQAEAQRAETTDLSALESVTAVLQLPYRYVLDCGALLQLDLATQRGVLRLASAHMGLDARELGFDALDDLLWRLRTDGSASGPHTLAAGVMWSVLSSTDTQTRVLSIHRSGVLPLHPAHPLLVNLRHAVLPYDISTPGAYGVVEGWILVMRTLAIDELPHDWRKNTDSWRAFVDADRIQSPALTVPAPAMRFTPLGMPGQHKSVGDYFTDRKTPLALRDHWPVIVDRTSGSLVWLCGHVIDHKVRITKNTKTVLSLTWRRQCQDESAETRETTTCAQT